MNRNEQIVKEVEARRNHGCGIDRFRSYLHQIGDPQQSLRCIHVAGTNGKGSTVNFIRSILQEAGYRVGTFTSPYLITHYDRIRINDVNIDAAAFTEYYDRYHQGWYDADLSSFEIDTVIAFLYFADQKVDFAIIEAGIGGRFDCTNVITPLCSVITNIGLDHMNMLGDDLEAIAWQKGGIIKERVPLVTGEKNPSCLRVLADICQEKQASLIPLHPIEQRKRQGNELSYRYDGLNIRLGTAAVYQCENSACALEVCRQLDEQNVIVLHEEQMLSGIKKAHWQGRFETMWEHPLIIIDGAHNEAAMRALCAGIADMGKMKILFAACADKDIDAMLRCLCATPHEVIISEFAYFRCARAETLAARYSLPMVKDYREVIEAALGDPDTPLLITGSLYFISEVRAYLMQRRIEKK